MKIGKWSTNASNNNATPPDGWPEGQAPSTVNDCAREMMAGIKTLINDADYIDYDSSPSYLSSTTFSLSSADSKFEVGRRIKLFDTTTLYGTINSVSATFVQVRLDSGILTSSLSSCALGSLRNANHALPEAAFQQQNMIINGQMEFWQRTASLAAVTNFQYVADRFRFEQGSASGSVNIYRLDSSANAAYVPTLASAGVRLNSSMNVLCSAADTVVATNDYVGISYLVEGWDWQRIGHRPLALSFQVNTNKSGIYAVSMRNRGLSGCCVQQYTVSAVNTWQRVFLTFPEAPTTFTWDYQETAGCIIMWTLQAGSTFQTSAGPWTAANGIATSSQVNFMANAGNSWSITDVRLKVGYADTPVAMRPYAVEKALCQRYFWRGLPCAALNTQAYTASCVQTWPIKFPTTMRVTPSVSSVLSGATWNNLDSATYSFGSPNLEGGRFLVMSTAANPNCNIAFGANDYFAADAEYTT